MCKSIILQLKTHRQIPHPENPLILVILILTISFFYRTTEDTENTEKMSKLSAFICVYLRLIFDISS